jgi:hypothetical protein
MYKSLKNHLALPHARTSPVFNWYQRRRRRDEKGRAGLHNGLRERDAGREENSKARVPLIAVACGYGLCMETKSQVKWGQCGAVISQI